MQIPSHIGKTIRHRSFRFDLEWWCWHDAQRPGYCRIIGKIQEVFQVMQDFRLSWWSLMVIPSMIGPGFSKTGDQGATRTTHYSKEQHIKHQFCGGIHFRQTIFDLLVSSTDNFCHGNFTGGEKSELLPAKWFKWWETHLPSGTWSNRLARASNSTCFKREK